MDGAAAGPATNRSSARPDGPHDPRAGEVESNTPADSPPSVPTDDERVFCPICHYNLTGILSGRCPECGSLFDREQLLKAQRADHVTLMPWDDPRVESRWRAFWATTWIVCGQPERFASAFSVQPQQSRSREYYVVCTGTAIFTLVALFGGVFALFGLRSNEFRIGAHAVATVVIATLVGNLVWPWVYAILVVHADGRRHHQPWIAIIRYAGAHLLLYAVVAPTLILVGLMFDSQSFRLQSTVILIPVGAFCIFLLWSLTVDAVVRFKTRDVAIRATTSIVVLWVGIGIFLATWVGMMVLLRTLW